MTICICIYMCFPKEPGLWPDFCLFLSPAIQPRTMRGLNNGSPTELYLIPFFTSETGSPKVVQTG